MNLPPIFWGGKKGISGQGLRSGGYESDSGLPRRHHGAYIICSHDIRVKFGKGWIKVHVTFDSELYVGNIVYMGIKEETGAVCSVLGIPKAIRSRIGKQPGDF